VSRILHGQEARATEILGKHRSALEAVAQALLEKETIDGAEVARLVQESLGETVPGDAMHGASAAHD
jgi:cell division protease FtsH